MMKTKPVCHQVSTMTRLGIAASGEPSQFGCGSPSAPSVALTTPKVGSSSTFQTSETAIPETISGRIKRTRNTPAPLPMRFAASARTMPSTSSTTTAEREKVKVLPSAIRNDPLSQSRR